jgi:hypothetical protein
MDDFAGLAGMGMAQPWWYSSIRCSVWGHSGPRAGRLDVHIAPAVGATSFPAPRGKQATPPEQSRPLRKRSQSRRNCKVGCWDGVFGEHVRSFPNISGLMGATAGKGARPSRLVAPRPRRVLLLWCISGSRAIPGHCRAIHVPSSLRKAKGIERGWP